MVTGDPDEWIEDGHVALHPLPAAEHYATLCNTKMRWYPGK